MTRDADEWRNLVADTVNSHSEQIGSLQHFQSNYEVDKQIEAIKELNEKLLGHAVNYTNLILAAGYAGFFALWSNLSGKAPDWAFSLSGLLIMLSLLLFIGWEVIKMIWQSIHMQRINNILQGQRGPDVIRQYQAAYASYQQKSNTVWIWFLIPTVASGFGAGIILMVLFAENLWKSFFC